jgi:hypothetical protein
VKLITITPQSVADRWRDQYLNCGLFRLGDGRKPQEIEAELRALPANATSQEIDAVMGNGSWTNLKCDDCGTRHLSVVVSVGEEPDDESRTVQLCVFCAQAAAALFNAEAKQ